MGYRIVILDKELSKAILEEAKIEIEFVIKKSKATTEITKTYKEPIIGTKSWRRENKKRY